MVYVAGWLKYVSAPNFPDLPPSPGRKHHRNPTKHPNRCQFPASDPPVLKTNKSRLTSLDFRHAEILIPAPPLEEAPRGWQHLHKAPVVGRLPPQVLDLRLGRVRWSVAWYGRIIVVTLAPERYAAAHFRTPTTHHFGCDVTGRDTVTSPRKLSPGYRTGRTSWGNVVMPGNKQICELFNSFSCSAIMVIYTLCGKLLRFW